jgi:hypothetical protein
MLNRQRSGEQSRVERRTAGRGPFERVSQVQALCPSPHLGDAPTLKPFVPQRVAK